MRDRRNSDRREDGKKIVAALQSAAVVQSDLVARRDGSH